MLDDDRPSADEAWMANAKMNSNLIGVGLYTPREAARLIGESPQRVGRWVRGYRVGNAEFPALWSPQVLLDRTGLVALGFRDLIQARVASALIGQGLSVQSVRRAIMLASDMLGYDRPLATASFLTDGRRVFLKLREEDEDRLVDVFTGQHAFREVVEPSLRSIDFGVDGEAQRWWPLGRPGRIVIDPQRAFGQPVDAPTGVPANVLADAAEAEGSVEAAAKAFDVPKASVIAAVEYMGWKPLRQAA